ncbi:I78 family peptidase inhibitor [Xylophilus sp. GW821-FHT01B05]
MTRGIHMPRSLLACLALVFSVQGCAFHKPPISVPPEVDVIGDATVCDAANVQFAVGKTVDARLGEEARARAHAKVVRVLRPGQIVTLEFSASRLTLDADEHGVVTRARCG